VPEDVLGKRVRCPYCFAPFTAEAGPDATPEPEPTPAPTAAAPHEDAPVEPDGERVEDLAPTEAPSVHAPAAAAEAPLVAAATAVAAKSFPPIRFVVLITRDPDQTLKGRLGAEISAEGLTLTRADGGVEARAPVGSSARYLGLNRLAVTIQGREVQMLLFKGGANQDRLTRDVAGFLDGKRPSLHPYDYARVWYVVLAALLPLALLAIAWPLRLLAGPVSVVFWVALAVALTTAGLVIARRARSHPGVRFLNVVWLDTAGALLLVGALLLGLGAPETISLLGWQAFDLPADPFRAGVALPPGPVRKEQRTLGGQPYTAFVVEVPAHHASFRVAAVELAGTGLPLGDPTRVFDDRKQSLRQEFPGCQLVHEDPLHDPNGYPGHLVVFRGVGGRSDGYCCVAMYQVRTRLYWLSASGPGLGPDSRPWNHFLRSFGVSPPIQPTRPDELRGLLLYFPFDEGAGLVAKSQTERGVIRGTLTKVAWVQGVRGHALQFNGPGTRFVFEGGRDLDFAAGQPFTIAGWFHPRSARGTILVFRQQRTPAPQLMLVLDNGVPRLTFQPNGSPRAISLGRDFVNNGQWCHFAVTRTVAGELTFYLNGVAQAQDFGAGGALTSDIRGLGCDPGALPPGAWQNEAASFRGLIDDFCVYNRALTADEIDSLAATPDRGPAP
jgi:hypothetical protein